MSDTDALTRAELVLAVSVARDQLEQERARSSLFQQEMLGIVGHDMREPLGAILFSAELLVIEAHEVAASEHAVSRIVSFARRMTRIVDQLLDLSHSRLGGGIPLARTKVHLSPIIRSVIDELTRVRRGSVLELGECVEVKGCWDEDRVRQVVSSVLDNALQHGLEGAPVQITVSLTADTATIAVLNQLRDGAIPSPMLDTLFEPYRRGWDSEHTGGGLGLGLYFAREIMRKHGGDVVVVASSADGTEFRITLPATEVAT